MAASVRVGWAVDLADGVVRAGWQVPQTEDGKLVICGDTHGQLADFLWVLKQNGEPSPTTGYLLNGDIADRGENASEIIIIALMYKILYPEMVSMNRGNHENIEMNRRSADHGGGFFDEVKSKFDPSLFLMFEQLFEVLPLATVLSDRVFVVHGGLFRRDAVQVMPAASDAVRGCSARGDGSGVTTQAALRKQGRGAKAAAWLRDTGAETRW